MARDLVLREEALDFIHALHKKKADDETLNPVTANLIWWVNNSSPLPTHKGYTRTALAKVPQGVATRVLTALWAEKRIAGRAQSELEGRIRDLEDQLDEARSLIEDYGLEDRLDLETPNYE